MSIVPPESCTASCNICGNALCEPIYRAAASESLTSLNTHTQQATTVWFCEHCTHVMTAPLEDIAAFYGEAYSLGIYSEDEDQLMKVENGREIYRTDYQKDTLLQKLNLPQGAKVLDYGSGKAGTLKKLLADRSDIAGHALDVSDHYIAFWQKFLPEGRYAVGEPPAEWHGGMDVVMSFFMLEHVADPLAILQQQFSLLKDGGTLYCVVPYLYKNPADMLVADHINHFSLPSVIRVLQRAGFADVEVDTEINPQWMVVTARKAEAIVPELPSQEELQKYGSGSAEIASYWKRMNARVAGFLDQVPAGEKAAIYGAGFYGSFIWDRLPEHGRIVCFIDRNTHLQGREHKGRPILPPERLENEIRHILVGLNPQVAEKAMGEVACWKDRNLTYHYLF